ncbi:MAG: 3-oxoacid CoA-transferase subunit B [Candidatus Tectomicrobia bacterium]|uniref:3-oxoacid CoA-transferase subunit B n=1 Tax=Tectimicrobiota bacterium TaxID=2528274 RepID=A0A932I0W9_UNCTE|nr:3-oxoacid CoA-transferase subunit B [Candidatus Tectomicrobia bacterium]
MTFARRLEAAALGPDDIARRVAREVPDGAVVNLGIGIPTRVANFVPPERGILFMAENGILGVGPRPPKGREDRDLVNASREPITALPGAAIFGHADSFAMIRGGHVDIAVLGALQVSAGGDLANWTVPGAGKGGIGGAMDLATGARAVYAIMTHLTKEGELKLLEECTYPLTARRVVTKLFTDIAFIEFTPEGPLLREVAQGLTAEDVQRASAPRLRVAEPLGALAREEGP